MRGGKCPERGDVTSLNRPYEELLPLHVSVNRRTECMGSQSLKPAPVMLLQHTSSGK
ncbi:MAG: hypothetical protein QOC81_2184 [Thermoanaerobaculia bacterium]|jgi:hypothetical protein|nr:hypothetical protein [Thermoanaerobaculia bacterium]